MNHCFVKGCTSGEKTLFAPSQFNLMVLQEWIKALPPRERPFDPRSDEVCRVHFNSEMLQEKDIYVLGVGGMKTVKKWSMLSGAIPSIFPENDAHPQGELKISENIQATDVENEIGLVATEDSPCDDSFNESNTLEVNSGSDTDEDSEIEEEFLKAEYLKVFSSHENQEKEDKSELELLESEFESAACANISTLNNQTNYIPRNQIQEEEFDFEILPSSSSELPRPLTIKIERMSEEDVVQGPSSFQHIDIHDTLNNLSASNSNGNSKNSSSRQQFIATKSFPSVSVQRVTAALSKAQANKSTAKNPAPGQLQGNSEPLEEVIKKKRGRPKGSGNKKNWVNRRTKIAPSVLLQKKQPKSKFKSSSSIPDKNVNKEKGSKCLSPPPPTLKKQPPIINSSDEDVSSNQKSKPVSVKEIPLALQKWLDKNNKSNNPSKSEGLDSDGPNSDSDDATATPEPHHLKISPKKSKSKMGRPKMQRRQKRKVLKVKIKTSTHLNPLGKVNEKVEQTPVFEKKEELSNKKLKSDKRSLTPISKLSPKESKAKTGPEPVETPTQPLAPVPPVPVPVPSREDPKQKLKDILTKMSTALVQKGKFKMPGTSPSSSLVSEVESNRNGLSDATGDSQPSKSSPEEKAHTNPTDFAAPVKRSPGRPRKLKVGKHTVKLTKAKFKKVLPPPSPPLQNPKSDSESDRESEPEPDPVVAKKTKHKLPSSKNQKSLSQKSIAIARKVKKSSYRRKKSHRFSRQHQRKISMAKRAEKKNSSTSVPSSSSGSKIKAKKDAKKDEHKPIRNKAHVSGNALQADKTKSSSKEEMLCQYPDVQVAVNNLSMEEIRELKVSLKNKDEGKASKKAAISKANSKSAAESESVPGPSKASPKKHAVKKVMKKKVSLNEDRNEFTTKEYRSWKTGITKRNVSVVVSDCESEADNNKGNLDAESSSVVAVIQPKQKQTAIRARKFSIGEWSKAIAASRKAEALLEKAPVPDSSTKGETVTVKNASAEVLGQRDEDLSSEDETDSIPKARAKSPTPSPSPSKAKFKRGRPRKIIAENVPSSNDINDDKLDTGRKSCESEITRGSNSRSASSSLSRKTIKPVKGDIDNRMGRSSKQKSKSPDPPNVESASSEIHEPTTPLILANDNSVSEPLFSSPSPPSGNTSKPRCFVLTCTHQSTKLFHAPLEDSSLFKEWLKYIPKRERPFTSNDKICSDHFPLEMLKTTQVNPRGKRINLQIWRWKLNLEAVPVLFRTPRLNLSPLVMNDNNEIFVDSVEKSAKKAAAATVASASTRRASKLKESTLEEVTCVVPGCEGTKDKNAKNRKLTFHKFPFAAEYRDLWVREISRKTGVIIPATVEFLDEIRICGLHFTATDYEGNVRSSPLRMRAVPSLFSLVKRSSNLNSSGPGPESNSSEAMVSPTPLKALRRKNSNHEEEQDQNILESDTILPLSLSTTEQMPPESGLNSSVTSGGHSRRKQNLSMTRSLSPNTRTETDVNAAPAVGTPERSSITNTSNTGTRGGGGRGKRGSKCNNKRSASSKANPTASITTKKPKTSNDTPRIPNPSPITFYDDENDDDFADDGHDPLDTHDQSESETNPGTTRSRSHSPELSPAAKRKAAKVNSSVAVVRTEIHPPVTSTNTSAARTGKNLRMDPFRPTITINQNIFESSHVDQPDLQHQNENAVQQEPIFTSQNVFQNPAPVGSQSLQQLQQQVANFGVGSGAGAGPGQEPTRTVMVPRYINLNGSGRMLVYEPLQIPMTLPLTPVPDGEVGVPSMVNPMSPAPSFQNYLQGHDHGVPLASPEQQQQPFRHDASSSPLGAVSVVASAVNSVPETPAPHPVSVPVPVPVPVSISRTEEILAEKAKNLPHVTITKLTPARSRQAMSKSMAESVALPASSSPPLVPLLPLQKPSRAQKPTRKQGPRAAPPSAAPEPQGKKNTDDVIPTNQTKLFRIDPNEGKYLISRKNGKTLVSPYDPKNLPAGVIKETVVTPNQGKIVFPSPQEGETILVVVPNNTISNVQSSPPVASGSKRKAPGSAGKKPLTGLSSSGAPADVISLSSDEEDSGSTQSKTTKRSTPAPTPTKAFGPNPNEKKTKAKAGPPLFLVEGDKLNLEKMYRWKEILKLPAGGSWSMQLLKESSQKNSQKYICIAETAVQGGSMVFQRVLKIKEDLNFEIFVKGSDCTSVLNENNEKIKSIRDLQDLVTNLSAFIVCNGLKGYGNVAAGSISTGKKVGDMWFSLKCEHLCLASNICAACAGLFKTVNASALMRVVNQSQVRPATPAPRAVIGPRSRMIALAQSRGQGPSVVVTRGVQPLIYHGVRVVPSAANPAVQSLPPRQQPPQQRLTRPNLLVRHSQPSVSSSTSQVPSNGNNIRFVQIAPRMPVLTQVRAQVSSQGTIPTQNESGFSDLLIITGEPGGSGVAHNNNAPNFGQNHHEQQPTIIQTDPQPTASTSNSTVPGPSSVPQPQPIQNMSLTSANNFSPVLPSSFSFSYLDPANL